MAGPEQIDREERARIKRLRETAKSRPHLNDATDKPSHAKTSKGRYRNNPVPLIYLGAHVASFSNPSALGDAIRKRIIENAERKAQRTEGLTVHVKNGKPITAYGAKMLGVPWEES